MGFEKPATNDSRIASSSQVFTLACDTNATSWDKALEFIYASWVHDTTPHSGSTSEFKLQWRRSGGSFADVGADTEIRYATAGETVLVDGTEPVGTSGGCQTNDVSHENEADNLTVGMAKVSAGLYAEIQWGIGFGSGALDSQTYELQVYDVTNTTALGQYTATITTAAGAVEVFKDMPLKISIESADTYKDIPLKISVESTDIYKDISLKVSIESADEHKDIPLKISILSADTYKDIPLKISIDIIPTYKDLPLKIGVESADTYLDIPLKVTVESEDSYKDIPLKVTVESTYEYLDIPLKISIYAEEFKDVPLKITVESANEYKDIPLKVSIIGYEVKGVSKNNVGSPLGSCECHLMKDNLDNTASFIGYDLSDGTGNYAINTDDNDAQYFVIFWKDDSPHVFDVTDHVLQPTVVT